MTASTPPSVDVIARAVYKARWVDNFGKQAVLATDEAIAEAVYGALTEIVNTSNAEAWSVGVKTALNHAILNEDGITLRLEHLDGRAWINPYEQKED